MITHSIDSKSNESAVVAQFMITKVVKIDGTLPITGACKKFIDYKVGSLLVRINGSNNEDDYGVLTKTDVLHCIAKMEDPGLARSMDFASNPLISCLGTDTLETAMLKMAKIGIKRLFVIDSSDKLLGIISSSDILRIAPGLMEILREEAFLKESSGIHKKELFEGICDDCKNHSEFLVDLGGFALCKTCVEKNQEDKEQRHRDDIL